jgi:hypothetical protein
MWFGGFILCVYSQFYFFLFLWTIWIWFLRVPSRPKFLWQMYVALMLFEVLMDRFIVVCQAPAFKSWIFTQIKFVFLLVFMNHLKMSLKITFKAKTFLANIAQLLFHLIMDTFQVVSQIPMLERWILTQITFLWLTAFVNHFNMPF